MKVNQIAQLAGIPAHVVRYYSRIGLLHPNRNPANGYNTFAVADVDRLQFIRLARHLGHSLADICAILHEASEGTLVPASLRARLRRRLAENVQRMQVLAQQVARMERALKVWQKVLGSRSNLRALCAFMEGLVGEENGRGTDRPCGGSVAPVPDRRED